MSPRQFVKAMVKRHPGITRDGIAKRSFGVFKQERIRFVA